MQLAIEQPDVLLLDEPDNHLDLEAKRHLEGFIRDYEGAVIIVSHDRYLLDEVATQIAELDNGQLTLYPGNYSQYATEVELRRLRQQQMYVAQQKKITQIEANIKEWLEKAKADLNERYARLLANARELLGDFRQVEENFKRIAREITERHAQPGVTKGAIVGHLLDSHDALRSSEQGQSFFAFWELLLSSERQARFQEMVSAVSALDLLDEFEGSVHRAGSAIRRQPGFLERF